MPTAQAFSTSTSACTSASRPQPRSGATTYTRARHQCANTSRQPYARHARPGPPKTFSARKLAPLRISSLGVYRPRRPSGGRPWRFTTAAQGRVKSSDHSATRPRHPRASSGSGSRGGTTDGCDGAHPGPTSHSSWPTTDDRRRGPRGSSQSSPRRKTSGAGKRFGHPLSPRGIRNSRQTVAPTRRGPRHLKNARQPPQTSPRPRRQPAAHPPAPPSQA